MTLSSYHIAALALLLAPLAHAEPLVPGFDRFHSAHPSAKGGRLLFNELGCVNCHGGTTGLPLRRGPELAGVTQRVQVEWLSGFLADPSGARAGTTMPHLLPPSDPGAVNAIVHYLGSLEAKIAKPKVQKHVNAARGRELFHTLGCVACHAADKNFLPPEGPPKEVDFTFRSVSFPALGEKYGLASLADFIRDPLLTRPDGRMPRTPMEEQDAVDLAGYLLDFQASDGGMAAPIAPFVPDKTLMERGRSLVTTLRCAACHNLPAEVATRPSPLRASAGGCLSDAKVTGVPHYDLSSPQRAALAAFLDHRNEPMAALPMADLTLDALNCAACHERDGRGGPDAARQAYFQGDHNLGDTGRYPPPLTAVGRKLQPEWLAKVLAGEFRVRPYLKTRMPVYGAATDALPALLEQADARPETPLPGGDDTAGRKLLGTIGGLSCITCHRWNGRPALGIQALDLSHLGQRLQPGWLREYLINPAAHRPGTLMPSFWPDGKASNREILGGDTDRQIASIYSFAKSANGEPEGFPDNTAGQFELIPKDQPIVQRTFMEGVGTHAILVGFPSGVHLAYDAGNARPALSWQGKFFDAYNTWFSRFAPFENPLGSSVIKWPEASPGDQEVRFEGYRLDARRVPVFVLSVGGVRVEERFEGIAHGLRRTLVWDAAALKSPPLHHPGAVTVTEAPNSAPGRRCFTYQWK